MIGRLHALVEYAAREAGVPIAVIRGPCRRRYIAWPRQKAMRRAYEEGFTTTQIGHAFNRDHTTVLYAAGALKKRPCYLREYPISTLSTGMPGQRGQS